jgi:hypothetical protein
MHLCCYEAQLSDLKLKTRPEQLLGYLPLGIILIYIELLKVLQSKDILTLVTTLAYSHFKLTHLNYSVSWRIPSLSIVCLAIS